MTVTEWVQVSNIIDVPVGPAAINLTAYQGDDFRLAFRINAKDLLTGVKRVLDLTGSVGQMQIRVAEARLSTLVLEPHFIPDFLGDGWAIFYADHSAMDTVDAGTYWYDAQLTSTAGIVKTFMRGLWTLTAEITTDVT